MRAAAVGALLAATIRPAFGQDDDLAARIAELERALDEVKAEHQAGEDVTARIEELEGQLADLAAAVDQGETEGAAESESPRAGEQGAPNPLRDEKQYLTGADLLDASFPGSWAIPGTPIRVKVGGYAKVDLIHDLAYVGDPYEFELATIAVEGTPEAELKGRTTFHAKETRLNFDFRSKASTPKGREFPLQAFVEIDFFDDRSAFALQPRLRHGYGVIGRLLAGRSWNISGDLQAIPGVIDFSGGDALYGGRVAQIRWQDTVGDVMTWAIGIEAPSTSIGNPLGLEGADRPRVPNVAGKIRLADKRGSHLWLGGDVFVLDWQGGESGPNAMAVGFGVNLAGRLLIGAAGRNALVAGGSVGRGSAHRVVALSFDGGNDAVITEDGLDVMWHWQAYGGFSLYWTDNLNSTISTAWTQLYNADDQPDSTIHRAGSAHLNLIWFPYKLVSTGGEVMWGQRVDKSGDQGNTWRFQYMAKFKFN